MRPQTPTKISERDRLFNDFYEFTEVHHHTIAKALRRIDRARANLITAQNALVALLSTTNNHYTQVRFAEFYAAGGVTEHDWEAVYTDAYQDLDAATPRTYGQLRVVATNDSSTPV